MILLLLVRILLIQTISIGNICSGVPLLTTLLPSSSTTTTTKSGTSTARPASLARGGAVLSTSDVTLVAGASTATGKHAVRAVNDLETKSFDLVSSSKKKENEFPIVHVHMPKNQKNNGNIQVYVIHVTPSQHVDREVNETSEDTEVKNEGRSSGNNDLTSGGFLQFIPSGIRRMFRALFSFDRRNFNLFNIFVNSNLHTA